MEVINLVTGPTVSQRLTEIKTLSCAGKGIVSELVLSFGQTDSQVVSSRKNNVASRCRYPLLYWLIGCYNNELKSVNLCWFGFGGQTVKYLPRLA